MLCTSDLRFICLILVGQISAAVLGSETYVGFEFFAVYDMLFVLVFFSKSFQVL